jgi:transglutaminase-like putative cysteine protease
VTTTGAVPLGAPPPAGGLLGRWRARREPGRRRREQAAPLAFSREKKLLLGLLAFLVAIPFPLNEPRPQGVVSWPVVVLYLGAVGYFLARTWRGNEPSLPPWAMNVAGLVYMPVFLVRLREVAPVHIARPMVELLLFALVMRFFGMRREREKWHVVILLFFLFVAAMATSVHPLILLYLIAALVLWLVILLRFLQLHLEEAYPNVVPGAGLRVRQLLMAFAVLTVIGAVPFFAFLPRLRAPYMMGAAAVRQAGYATGFRDQVNLDVVGNVRASAVVALRMKPEDPTFRAPTLLRGTTYDRFRENSWLRSQTKRDLLRPVATNLFRLAEGETAAKVKIWLEPIVDTRSLILPVESLSVELSERLYSDVAGGVVMTRPRGGLLEYRVGVADHPIYRAEPPDFDDPDEATLDRGGISPRIEELAQRLAGSAPPAEAAQRIQQYLDHNYEYTLDFVGRRAERPIDDFLFRYRSGHCEFFATSMILMLRSVGVPARLATGFLGAEFNPLEDYYIVRQSNAHAWVEAWLPATGWSTFDPTPPAGRPLVLGEPNMRLVLRQAWDYFEFRWDRYVMSFGFFDQVDFILQLRDFLRRMSSSGPGSSSLTRNLGPLVELDPSADRRPGGLTGLLPILIGAALAVVLFVLIVRAGPPYPTATRSYRALRAAAARRDPAIGAATGPLALRRWLAMHVPAAEAPAAGLIDRYLIESYRGARLSRSDAAAVRRDWRELRRLLKRAPARPTRS